MFTAEGDSHSPAATRQRNDRDADFRCGANPQRGESSWAFRLKIYDPSPVSSPPASSGTATNSGENLPLIVPQLRALMDTRLGAEAATEQRVVLNQRNRVAPKLGAGVGGDVFGMSKVRKAGDEGS